jgi:head-tail adaptor
VLDGSDLVDGSTLEDVLMRSGRMNRLVSLSRSPQTTPDSDGFFESLNPASAWVAIEPLDASLSDSTRLLAHRVTMRFHKQVTVDTRIVYSDPVLGRDRELFVKGVQNMADANRELVLYCEEAVL